MLVLIGPSASGKTEIANLLIKNYQMKKVVTCTTRDKRVGEVDKVHYNFMTKEEFLKRKENNEFVETTFYNGNYYGTLKKDVSDEKIVVLDPNGLNSFYNKMPNEITSFYLNADENIRYERMIKRQDKEDDIKKRLLNDKNVFNMNTIKRVDYIINSSFLTIEELTNKIHDLYLKK